MTTDHGTALNKARTHSRAAPTKVRVRAALTTATLMVALLLVSCGGSAGSKATDAGSTASATDTEDPLALHPSLLTPANLWPLGELKSGKLSQFEYSSEDSGGKPGYWRVLWHFTPTSGASGDTLTLELESGLAKASNQQITPGIFNYQIDGLTYTTYSTYTILLEVTDAVFRSSVRAAHWFTVDIPQQFGLQFYSVNVSVPHSPETDPRNAEALLPFRWSNGRDSCNSNTQVKLTAQFYATSSNYGSKAVQPTGFVSGGADGGVVSLRVGGRTMSMVVGSVYGGIFDGVTVPSDWGNGSKAC